MPSFPGGEGEMFKFFAENMKYPSITEEEFLCSRFVVRFVVGADGCISDIRMIRGCSDAVNKGVVDVIKKMPKWIPGKQNGLNVAVYYTFAPHIDIKR
ncbi:energy transducer TonB [Dysgonomonas sp. 511]|uniref:energy transducer TonB n=1 Tax=Dysgonomonas sp. 511 TaxID=2302930 RepID=UPI0013D5AF44|nr:energy transducer TonB [Dysgonomonas sp. 511]NDV79820.1 hypothetical protein [Dysgonomonas sp. 511]